MMLAESVCISGEVGNPGVIKDRLGSGPKQKTNHLFPGPSPKLYTTFLLESVCMILRHPAHKQQKTDPPWCRKISRSLSPGERKHGLQRETSVDPCECRSVTAPPLSSSQKVTHTQLSLPTSISQPLLIALMINCGLTVYL